MVLIWLLAALSFLPLWQTDRWWVRLWDFPRLQVAVSIIAALLLLVFATKRYGPLFWTGMSAGAAALIWQASHFAAYVPPLPKQMAGIKSCPPGRSISLLNVNVLQDNRRYREVIELVRRVAPDVLLLLETDRAWAEAVRPLANDYPYRIGEVRPNTYGMLLFSRLPMEGKVLHRVQEDIPSIDARIRLPDGASVTIHAVHPEPPLPGDDSGERDAELVLVGRDMRRSGGAAMVMGDLNDVAWSRTSRLFRQVAAVNDPRAGRGFYPTFHADYPVARWPLDHLFATPHFRLLEIDRLGDIGSDHFPIFYRLCLVTDPDKRMASPSADPDVASEASQEVRAGRQERSAERRQGE